MPKPKDFPDEMLDFAQSYTNAAIILLNNRKVSPPFGTIHKHDKANVLCAHLLMCHGVELHLKTMILLMGGIPDVNRKGHDLENLLEKTKKLWSGFYEENFLGEKHLGTLSCLNRNFEFRYPLDKKLKKLTEIYQEAEKWSDEMVGELEGKWVSLRRELLDQGYKFVVEHKQT